MTVEGKKYYTNITDKQRLAKCVNFCKSGCLSYAISFDNSKDAIIQTVSLKNIKVNYLRKMNFEQCFLPERAANLNDSESVLKKGLDLIEIV